MNLASSQDTQRPNAYAFVLAVRLYNVLSGLQVTFLRSGLSTCLEFCRYMFPYHAPSAVELSVITPSPWCLCYVIV